MRSHLMALYDSTLFEPPAPLARVTLRDPISGTVRSDVVMLLDTGADVTLVPKAAIASFSTSLLLEEQHELLGFDGSSVMSSPVRLGLYFCRRTFRGLFLIIDEPWGILGRNVLNTVPILLDGPRLTWTEHRPS